MLSDWSTFTQDLSCFNKYKPCLPDFSSKSLFVILTFPLLIESFLLRGNNGISTMVALWHFFLQKPQIVFIISLTSSSGGLWSRLQRIKIYLMLGLFEKFKFCILHNTCWILSPGIPKSIAGKVFFSKFQSFCLNWR